MPKVGNKLGRSGISHYQLLSRDQLPACEEAGEHLGMVFNKILLIVISLRLNQLRVKYSSNDLNF
jgi:hypothetical protein